VHGDADNGQAAVGGVNAGTGAGVSGTSTNGYGVYGSSSAAATSSSAAGVYGVANEWGVYGTNTGSSTSAWGIYGVGANNGNGVYGSGAAYGVYGKSTASGGSGVTGDDSYGNGYGVVGTSANGYGVYATSSNGTAIYANGGNTGVYAVGPNAIVGSASGAGSIGVWGGCTGNCTAVYSHGNLEIDGSAYLVSGFSFYYGSTCQFGACLSDERLKKSIEPLAGAMDKLLQIKGVTYEWKNPDDHHPSGRHAGVIAQDVEKVFPEWVTENSDGMKAINIDQREMLGVTVESIRTLKTSNDLLKERVAALESGRQPRVAGFNLNGVGFGVGGLAIAGALLISRRKREERPSTM
jgi:hypothetical protein